MLSLYTTAGILGFAPGIDTSTPCAVKTAVELITAAIIAILIFIIRSDTFSVTHLQVAINKCFVHVYSLLFYKKGSKFIN